MKLMSMFNGDVAYDLKLTLDDMYILGYFYKLSTISEDTKIIKDCECFSFNLVDLFKSRKHVFEQVEKNSTPEEIKKIYEKNRKKLDRLLKGTLGKFVNKELSVKTKEGSKTYYKLNRQFVKILIDGYPEKIDRQLNEKELLICKELNMDKITKGISKQLESMELDILKESIEVAKETGILDYPYVKGIYNNLIENKKVASTGNTNNSNKESFSNINDKNIIPKNNQNINNEYVVKLNPKIHNFKGSANFMKYQEKELEDLLLEVNKTKFK